MVWKHCRGEGSIGCVLLQNGAFAVFGSIPRAVCWILAVCFVGTGNVTVIRRVDGEQRKYDSGQHRDEGE